MELPLYVELESGLQLNLSQIVAIHPRQPNGSLRVQAQGTPSLIVISPVTDNDVEEIRAATNTCKELLAQQLGQRNPSPVERFRTEERIPMTDDEIAGAPTTKPAKKTKKKRARRPVAA